MTTPGGRQTPYSVPAIVLHWAMAAAIFAAIPLGLAMVNVAPGPMQNLLYDLHRSFGALILALAAIRLAIRLWKGRPASHPGLAPWQRIASRAAHESLYVLIFVVPLLGWAGTSAFGAPITVFGLFVLPPILAIDEELSKILLFLHRIAAFTLAAIVAVHVAAALWHGLIQRDGVLSRMIPGIDR